MDYIIKRHNRKSQSKNYFTPETEEAIIAYNNTQDPKLRSFIYEKYIHFAFFKLTQNIIHTFKFHHTDVDNLEHLQQEIIIFLLSKIHLYNHTTNIEEKIKKIIIKEFNEEYNDNFTNYSGNKTCITQSQINEFVDNLDVTEECKSKLYKINPPKAYSYFGTIVKRWLIIYNQNNYKKLINNIPLDVISDNSNKDNLNSNYNEYIIDDDNYEEVEKNEYILSLFFDEYIEFCLIHLKLFFPNKDEAHIADVVLDVFKRRKNIQIFNKKAIYIYIREKLNFEVKTPKLTKIIKKLEKIFKEKYLLFINDDEDYEL